MSNISTPFTITDTSHAGVAAASISIGGTALTLGTTANVSAKKLVDGTALTNIAVTVYDLGDGDYALVCDPDTANGELHFSVSASKIGVTLAMSDFGISVTRERSRITAYLDSDLATIAATLSSTLTAVNGIPAALMATTVDATLTVKQALVLSEAIISGNFSVVRNTVSKTITVTYYRQDGTTVLATLTTTYSDSALTLATGRTIAFGTLP